MTVGLLEGTLEAYANPRASARRVLKARPSLLDCVLMIVASSAASVAALGLGAMASGAPTPEGPRLSLLGQFLQGTALSLAIAVVIASLAWTIGRRFEGRGGREDLLIVVCWHTLVGLAVNVAVALTLALAPPLSGLVLMGGMLYLVYMLAAFIAEAHGFQNVWTVVLGLFASSMAVAIIVLIFLSLLGVQPETLAPPS